MTRSNEKRIVSLQRQALIDAVQATGVETAKTLASAAGLRPVEGIVESLNWRKHIRETRNNLRAQRALRLAAKKGIDATTFAQDHIDHAAANILKDLSHEEIKEILPDTAKVRWVERQRRKARSDGNFDAREAYLIAHGLRERVGRVSKALPFTESSPIEYLLSKANDQTPLGERIRSQLQAESTRLATDYLNNFNAIMRQNNTVLKQEGKRRIIGLGTAGVIGGAGYFARAKLGELFAWSTARVLFGAVTAGIVTGAAIILTGLAAAGSAIINVVHSTSEIGKINLMQKLNKAKGQQLEALGSSAPALIAAQIDEKARMADSNLPTIKRPQRRI